MKNAVFCRKSSLTGAFLFLPPNTKSSLDTERNYLMIRFDNEIENVGALEELSPKKLIHSRDSFVESRN